MLLCLSILRSLRLCRNLTQLLHLCVVPLEKVLHASLAQKASLLCYNNSGKPDLSKLLACAPGTQGDVAALEQSLHERDGHLTAALEQLAQLKGQLARRESALAQAGALVGWVGRDRSDCVRVRVCVCAPRGAFPTPSRLSRPLSCAAKQRQKRAWLAIVCELLEHPASIPVMQYPRASWACF
eukprot:1161902-Pelagomonas_calceolata.AAC.2